MAEVKTASDFAALLSKNDKDLASIKKKPTNVEVEPPSFTFVEKTQRTETIAYLEQIYFKKGVYPHLKDINRHLKEQNFAPVDIDFLESLHPEPLQNRGLPPYMAPSSKDWEQIDYRFQLAVSFLCDFSDKRNHAAKLKEAGLTTKEWAGLIRRQNHYKYFTDRLDQVWARDVEPRAKLAIAKGIENGDLNAVKYFHEYTDRYRPEQAQMMNLTLVISGMLEILAKYVQKEVLANVALEMEQAGLLQGSKQRAIGA